MKIKTKKGQVSTYILVGIVLLILMLIVLQTDEEVHEKPQVQELSSATTAKIVRTFVSGCLEGAGKEALVYVARLGGYAEPPEEFIEFAAEGSRVVSVAPYYQVHDEMHVPTEDTVRASIAHVTTDRLGNCTETFLLPGHNVTFGEPQVIADLKPGSQTLRLALTMPTTITTEEDAEIITLQEYTTSIQTRLIDMWLLSANVAYAVKDEYCLSCVTQMIPHDVEVSVVESHQPPDYVAIHLLSYNEKFDDNKQQALFTFATKYATDTSPQNIQIHNDDELTRLTATLGRPFTFDVITNNPNNSLFSDDSEIFDVNPKTGHITGVLDSENLGMHIFEVRATDSDGHWDSALVQIEVTE